MAEGISQYKLFTQNIYCIDASSLVNIFRHVGIPYPPYPEDVFPSLWEKLSNLIKQGRIISHITVYNKLKDKGDKLAEWCKINKKIFKDIDECQLEKIEEIRTKYDRQYWQIQIDREGDEWEDPWIIALAICEEALIVTDEKNTSNRIPYIANHFSIKSINLMNFFREIDLKL